MLQSFVSPEEGLGSQIRRQRVVVDGSATREIFCQKHESALCGVTPDILYDMEKGVLLGSQKLEHMITVILLLWPKTIPEHARIRTTLIEQATQVIARRKLAVAKIENVQSLTVQVSAQPIYAVPAAAGSEKLGRLDHRGGRY